MLQTKQKLVAHRNQINKSLGNTKNLIGDECDILINICVSKVKVKLFSQSLIATEKGCKQAIKTKSKITKYLVNNRNLNSFNMDVIKKDDSDFKCLKCSKVFKHKVSLAKHTLSHKPRREWPIKCVFCEEFFQVSLPVYIT